jgi:TDG/mug DNA glycosylase family protein
MSEKSDDAIGKLQQLALDCAALSVELQFFAVPKIEASMGASKEELLDFVLSLDPAQIQQQTEREQVEAIGRRFWQRLQQVGVIEASHTGREDDAAFLAGIGFTDIVKRPTARADAISSAEFEHGRELLAEKLRRHRPTLLIFTFKKTATTLRGPFKGHGHLPELEFAGAQVFVMPGPYERADRVAAALPQLPDLLAN